MQPLPLGWALHGVGTDRFASRLCTLAARHRRRTLRMPTLATSDRLISGSRRSMTHSLPTDAEAGFCGDTSGSDRHLSNLLHR